MVVRRWLGGMAVAAAGLLATGCGQPSALNSPGGRQVTFQLWESPSEPPMVIDADQLLQVEAGSFDRMRFINVTVRRPMPDGVLVLSAPSGDFQRRPDSTIELQGPVMISGELQGEPVVGTAARARMSRPLAGGVAPAAAPGGRGGSVVVEMFGGQPADDPAQQAVLLYQGNAMRSPQFTATGIDAAADAAAGGVRGLRIVTVPPTVVDQELPDLAAVLAGLPHPLVLPTVLPHLAP
jgi:hypothetical protein